MNFEKNWVFDTKSDFVTRISLQPDVVDNFQWILQINLKYQKTKPLDWKIWFFLVCGKSSVPKFLFIISDHWYGLPGFRFPVPCYLVSSLDCSSWDGRQTKNPDLQTKPFGVSTSLSSYSNIGLELTPERSGRENTHSNVSSILNQPDIFDLQVKPSLISSKCSNPERIVELICSTEPGEKSRTLPRTRVHSKYILSDKKSFRDEDLVWLWFIYLQFTLTPLNFLSRKLNPCSKP